MLHACCSTWDEIRRRFVKLLADELRNHECDDSHYTCESYPEWAPIVSTAFDPMPGHMPRKPFLGSPAWTRNLNFLCSLGLSHVADVLENVIPPSTCEKVAGNALKKLAVIAKASSARVPEANWLVDINRWRGHMIPLSGSELFSAAAKWLCTPHEQLLDYSLNWLIVNYATGAQWFENVFAPEPFPAHFVQYAEVFWTARPWGTTGASDKYNIVAAERNGKPLLATKTKNNLALYTDTNALLSRTVAPHREVILVGPKFDEYGKARHILRGDDVTYLQHSYADGILYANLSLGVDSRRSPITSSPNDWRLVLRQIGAGVDKRYLNVLFDHSGFDEHQSVFLVRSFLLYLLEVARRKYVPSADPLLFEAKVSATLSSAIEVPGGVFVGRHVGGLPSGWRWTALMDTVLNVACTMSAWQIIAPTVRLHNAVMLGDDSLVQVSRQFTPSALHVAAFLTHLGYELNPTKNYMSYECGDFLGYSFYGANRIFGAPSRLMTSLTCRHNTRENPGGAYTVALARIWLWALFKKRAQRSGMSLPPMDRWIRRDVYGATRLDADSLMAALETPKSKGGVGIMGIAKFLGFHPTTQVRCKQLTEAEFQSGVARLKH
nr:RNA-dependent RNA polymerase [Molussus totiviridae 1]